MPYVENKAEKEEEAKEAAEVEEAPEEESTEDAGDSADATEEYTSDEMLEYMLREVTSLEAAKELLEEHGFALQKIGAEDEMAEDEMEEMEEMPMPMPVPMHMGRPRINIVELRLGAAKNALGKTKRKGA